MLTTVAVTVICWPATPVPGAPSVDTIRSASVATVGVTELEAFDHELVPTVLVVFTQHEYVVPLLRPVTTIGELVPVP